MGQALIAGGHPLLRGIDPAKFAFPADVPHYQSSEEIERTFELDGTRIKVTHRAAPADHSFLVYQSIYELLQRA